MGFKNYERLLKQYEGIMKILKGAMKQHEESSKENKNKEKVKDTEHERIVKEHIEYICERTIERKINIADVWLTKLQDGMNLTVEEVEQYAKDKKYIISGKCYNDQSVSCVKIYVGKVL